MGAAGCCAYRPPVDQPSWVGEPKSVSDDYLAFAGAGTLWSGGLEFQLASVLSSSEDPFDGRFRRKQVDLVSRHRKLQPGVHLQEPSGPRIGVRPPLRSCREERC